MYGTDNADDLNIVPDDEELELGAAKGDEAAAKDRGDTLETGEAGDETAAAAAAGDDAGAADGGEDDEDAVIRIPKARFDQVNTRRQMAEARAAQLEEELQRARSAARQDDAAATPPPEQIDLKALRKERMEALMEGDADRAGEIDEQIEGELERRATERAMQAMSQREQEREFKAAVTAATETFPFLDSQSPKANAEAIGEVVEWRDFYINKGMSPADALTKAVGKVGPQYATDDAAAPPASKSKGEQSQADQLAARRRAIIERNAKLNQPPSTSKLGTGERAESAKAGDVGKMTDDEFEKLPAAEKRRLRGD